MVNRLSQTHYITIPMSQKDCMIEIKNTSPRSLWISVPSVFIVLSKSYKITRYDSAVLMIHRIKRNNKGAASPRFFKIAAKQPLCALCVFVVQFILLLERMRSVFLFTFCYSLSFVLYHKYFQRLIHICLITLLVFLIHQRYHSCRFSRLVPDNASIIHHKPRCPDRQ
ncbi:MAG: hypothetical protein H6Q69_4256 [Firmicutes bacterium]|nr:hypothetical protein [Bacillota bacterium]